MRVEQYISPLFSIVVLLRVITSEGPEEGEVLRQELWPERHYHQRVIVVDPREVNHNGSLRYW